MPKLARPKAPSVKPFVTVRMSAEELADVDAIVARETEVTGHKVSRNVVCMKFIRRGIKEANRPRDSK